MKFWNSKFVLIAFLAAWVLNADIALAQEKAEEKEGAAKPLKPAVKMVELRGHIVCLAEEMHRLHGTDLPTKHLHVLGFRTNDGQYYTLLRTKYSLALFDDPRLRQRELIVKGRVLPNSRVLDVNGKLKSVKDGVVHDLYYFCEVCVIRSIVSGPCMCCQDDYIFVEKPLSN